MGRWAVIAAALAVLVAAGGPALLAKAREAGPELSGLVREGGVAGQSAAQISAGEFLRLQPGVARDAVRELVGEPERTHRVEVEGLAIDCWYYGIVGATGAYQLCFTDGRLSSKLGFAAPTSESP